MAQIIGVTTTFSDTFVEGSNIELNSHTPTGSPGGTAWTKSGADPGGQQTIVSASTDNVYGGTDSGVGYPYYLCDNTGSADGYVEAQAQSLSASCAGLRLGFRVQNSSNFVGHYTGGTGGSGSRLCKVVGGSTTNLVLFQGTIGAYYTITGNGTDVAIYKNGLQQGSTQTVSDFSTETSKGFCLLATTILNIYDTFQAGTWEAGGFIIGGVESPAAICNVVPAKIGGV